MEKKNNNVVTIVIVVIVVAIISTIIWALASSDEDTGGETTAVTTEEASNEETVSDESQDANEDEESSSSDDQQSAEDSTNEGQETEDGNADDAAVDIAGYIEDFSGTGTLPPNWGSLSSSNKVRINPYGCLDTTQIRADNGQCLSGGSSLDTQPLVTDEELLSLLGCVVANEDTAVNFDCTVADSEDTYSLIMDTQVNIQAHIDEPTATERTQRLSDCTTLETGSSGITWLAITSPDNKENAYLLSVNSGSYDAAVAVLSTNRVAFVPVDICDISLEQEVVSLLDCEPTVGLGSAVKAYNCVVDATDYQLIYSSNEVIDDYAADSHPDRLAQCERAGNNISDVIIRSGFKTAFHASISFGTAFSYDEIAIETLNHDYSAMIAQLEAAEIGLTFETVNICE